MSRRNKSPRQPAGKAPGSAVPGDQAEQLEDDTLDYSEASDAAAMDDETIAAELAGGPAAAAATAAQPPPADEADGTTSDTDETPQEKHAPTDEASSPVVPEARFITIRVPLAPPRSGARLSSGRANHVDAILNPGEDQVLRQIVGGLDVSFQHLENGARPRSKPDAVRWLLQQIAAAVPATSRR